jgi:hypothetical protein
VYRTRTAVVREPVTTTVVVPPSTTPPTTGPSSTAVTQEEGSFIVDPTRAKVSTEVNTDNDTTMKKFDIPNGSADGYQIYAVGTEFEGSFYLLLKTRLKLTDANGQAYLQEFPTNLDMNIEGAAGDDFLFRLPFSAENGPITVHFTP